MTKFNSKELNRKGIRFAALIAKLIKGTVRVISRDHPLKDGGARFTTVPCEIFLIKYTLYIYVWFCFIKLFFFICGFSAKVTCAFLVSNNQEINTYRVRKTSVSSIFSIRLRFPGNHLLKGASLEISLLVPTEQILDILNYIWNMTTNRFLIWSIKDVRDILFR